MTDSFNQRFQCKCSLKTSTFQLEREQCQSSGNIQVYSKGDLKLANDILHVAGVLKALPGNSDDLFKSQKNVKRKFLRH